MFVVRFVRDVLAIMNVLCVKRQHRKREFRIRSGGGGEVGGRRVSFFFLLLASILWGDRGKEIGADIIREKREKGVGQ